MHNNNNNGQSFGTRQPSLPPNAPRLRPSTLPAIPYAGPTLHTSLLYAAHPQIIYDLRYSPSVAQARRAPSEWAYEPAIYPTTPVMTLGCRILSEPIIVFPSHEGYDHVIVRDVLLAVHEAYCAAQHADPNFSRDAPGDWIPGFSGHSTISTRHIWGGVSEQIGPGAWLLHIE